jgi:hypothetical protein
MIFGDPDPISAGTAGDAALWGGSIAAVGMTANPLGAHQVSATRWLNERSMRSLMTRGVAEQGEEVVLVCFGTPHRNARIDVTVKCEPISGVTRVCAVGARSSPRCLPTTRRFSGFSLGQAEAISGETRDPGRALTQAAIRGGADAEDGCRPIGGQYLDISPMGERPHRADCRALPSHFPFPWV